MHIADFGRRGLRSFVTGLALLVAALLPGCSDSPGIGPAGQTPSAAYRTAVQAYIWGFPLVYNTNKFTTITSSVKQPTVKNNAVPMAPANQICYMSNYVTPDERAIQGPNLDTIYGSAWLDLSQEPVVVRVPDMGSRYWIFQMTDFYTNVFASPGSRRGSSPGNYLVVGPDWKGTPPSDIVEVLQSPTHLVYVLSRVGCSGQGDLPNVLPLINHITVCPLSQVGTFPTYVDWTSVKQIQDENKTPDWTPDNTYWTVLRSAMQNVEVPADQQEMVAGFLAVLNSTDPAVQADLGPALVAGKQAVAQTGALVNFGSPAGNDWRCLRTGGAFGTDYLTRAGTAYTLPYYNLLEDAAYYTQVNGSDGLPLDGARSYKLHFEASQLPPLGSTGFWSVTLYGNDLFLVTNSINRYNLGTHTPGLQYNNDGSVDIYLQNSAPLGHESNWIPTPAGGFNAMLRAYVPQSSILDGSYAPQPLNLVP